MRFLRKLVAPIAGLVAALVALLAKVPSSMVGVSAAAIGQLAANFVTTERDRDSMEGDGLRDRRAAAYEQFGAAVALGWNAAGILLTFRPKLLGYAHGLATLVRAQRRFEEQTAAAAAALASVLLHGSTETQRAAIDAFRTLGESYTRLAKTGPPGWVVGKEAVTQGNSLDRKPLDDFLVLLLGVG